VGSSGLLKIGWRDVVYLAIRPDEFPEGLNDPTGATSNYDLMHDYRARALALARRIASSTRIKPLSDFPP
jgi:hypothetical protein